jgi:hypothetical protein
VCPTTADTVTFNAAATDWQSTGRGTLIVQCQSSVVDDALKGCVGMTVTYVNRDGTDTKPMLYLGAGAWLLNAERRVREPTRITCKSLLNGTVSFNGVP